MTETTIYIETLLTDKVLEGLPKNYSKYYFCITEKGKNQSVSYDFLINKVYDDLTHIVLPIKLTTDMLQKEAEKRWAGKLGTNKEERDCIYMGFCECFYWLLNLNKEGEK